MNYSLFGSFVDFILWSLTILTIITYLRVSISNPGYVEANIVMTEAHEEDLHAFDTQPDKHEVKQKGIL